MSVMHGIEELQEWDKRIREKAAAFGLDCYPQQFEICDHHQMLSSMAYSGLPVHYPHWSYGKSYEKQKTLYDYGVSGLPYEMVINSNPALAYLMRDNSLLLQILTIAHVYAHNDFFKNNFTFRTTHAEYAIDTFKAHRDRIREYIADPSIGLDKAEKVLDAAHAISLQCRRNLAIRKRTPAEERTALMESSSPPIDPFQSIHPRKDAIPPDLNKTPAFPDEDLLLFIRDHNHNLARWEKDILTIVHEEAQYFIPQIETKIMNEGWATYWHKKILDSLSLPENLQLEFMVRHNQVVRPLYSELNPYHLGFALWQDVHRRGGIPTSEGAEPADVSDECAETDKIFEIRESDRDSSFLRRNLTEQLIRKLNLFEYETKGEQKVVRSIADQDGWIQVKNTILKNVGMNAIPAIKVEDADFGNKHTLHLVHDHDGRDLQLEYAEKTLSYISQLWQGEVALETIIEEQRHMLIYREDSFSIKELL
jgi:stage V sporulation protein R